MPALSDPKLEAFSRYLLRNLIAKQMAKGKACEKAAIEAGYSGSSLTANARKRGNRKDVKARMAELAEELATPEQKREREILAIDLAEGEKRLWDIIQTPIALDETVMPKDIIGAFRALSDVRGWNAPTRNEHTGKDGSPLLAGLDRETAAKLLEQLLAARAQRLQTSVKTEGN